MKQCETNMGDELYVIIVGAGLSGEFFTILAFRRTTSKPMYVLAIFIKLQGTAMYFAYYLFL